MLLDWINDELADHRIIVKDMEEDMYDGQVLQKLVGEHSCQHFKKFCFASVCRPAFDVKVAYI